MKTFGSFIAALLGLDDSTQQRLKTLEIQNRHLQANVRELYESAWRHDDKIEKLEDRVRELEAHHHRRMSIGSIGELN